MSDPILYDYIKQAQTGEPEAILRLEEYMRLRDHYARQTGVEPVNHLIVEEEDSDPDGHKVVINVFKLIGIAIVIGLLTPRGMFAPAFMAVCICGVMLYFLAKMNKERTIKEYIEENTPKPQENPTKPKRKTKMRVKKSIYEP